MIAIAAASGAMAVACPVYADSAADGSAVGSPGVISGNTLQVPVHAPVNVCGNTVNVVGLLNPATGNGCANQGGGGSGAAQAPAPDQAPAPGGATAEGGTHDSPGVASGNDIQVPVHVPVNVSGNSVNVVGIGNPAEDNTSTNTSTDRPDEPQPEPPTRVTPPKRSEPPAKPQPRPAEHAVPKPGAPTVGALAHTGADSTWTAVAASVASLVGGTVLYRRSTRKLRGEG
ncbi:chaplin family protein [Streptomyces sp. NPDC006314]|uniref:chaplin n=1 Tax=Streptomyces sp. NPDC006314 TaxID=3154475 RepID=UPI0033A894D5